MTTRAFHVGDILSITHDRLVSPDHIGGVYKILGWMSGEDLMTHQLPRVSRECEPSLRAPLREGDHTVIDPIAELKMLKPDAPIITVDPSTGEVGEA